MNDENILVKDIAMNDKNGRVVGHIYVTLNGTQGVANLSFEQVSLETVTDTIFYAPDRIAFTGIGSGWKTLHQCLLEANEGKYTGK